MKKCGVLLLVGMLCLAWSAATVLAASDKDEAPAKAAKSEGAKKAEKEVKADKPEKKAEKKAEKAEAPKKVDEPKKVEKPKAESSAQIKQVTHCDLAKLLVEVLGLARFLPANPSCDQCFTILMQNRIQPAEGWVTDSIVTKADLARVIVESMQKQSEVKNPNDPQSWVDYLKSIGIPIETVGEAADYLEPLSQPVAPAVAKADTDPLTRPYKLNPSDELNYGVDMGYVMRVLSQMEIQQGEFRPLTPY